jgi:hypothetical protein
MSYQNFNDLQMNMILDAAVAVAIAVPLAYLLMELSK